jgi:hypothetical protein
MENAPEQNPLPEWAVAVRDALAKYRALSGKQRKSKLPMTHRDVERELSWHDHERTEGKLSEEQYWKAVGETLHNNGLFDLWMGV